MDTKSKQESITQDKVERLNYCSDFYNQTNSLRSHKSDYLTKSSNNSSRHTQPRSFDKDIAKINSKTFPLPLIRAIALLVSLLFSYLTATPAFGQEPVGLGEIKPLSVGNKVPEDFWTREHLFYVNGDTVRKTLEEHKGKMLVLDFWMIGCSKCFLHQKEISHFKSKYKDDLAVVMVNGIRTKNDYSRIHKYLTSDWINGLGLTHFSSIIKSNYFDKLFNPQGYPSYYWINRLGYVQTITFRNLLDREYKAPFLDI